MTKAKKSTSVQDKDGSFRSSSVPRFCNFSPRFETDPRCLENVVLQYLRKTNRPYNATDIHTNLNNALTKTSVAKALDKLTDKQLAFSKAYGKSIIYSVAQDEDNVVSPDEMAKLDSHIEKLTQQLASLKEAKVEKMNDLKKLNSTLPTLEAQSLLTQLKVQNHEAAQRLASCQNQNDQISVNDKQRIEKEYDTNINLWKSRKKLFNEIFKTVTEHLPGKVSDFKEEIGIEEDPQSLESVLVEYTS